MWDGLTEEDIINSTPDEDFDDDDDDDEYEEEPKVEEMGLELVRRWVVKKGAAPRPTSIHVSTY